MKILLASLNFWPELTGIGKFNGELAFWLARRGHEVKVIAAPPYYPQWRIQADYRKVWYSRECVDGVSIVRSPLWVPNDVTARSRLLHLFSFAASSSLPLLSQLRWRPDITLMTEPPIILAPTVLAAARLTGALSWLHVQDLEVDAAFDLGILGNRRLKSGILAAESKLMRSFDQVSTISAAMRNKLVSKGLESSSVSIWPNWVDVDAIRPMSDTNSLRTTLGIAEHEIVALYSGNMGAKQGVDCIVTLAKRLIQRRPDIRFLLCGAGAEFQHLRQLSEGVGNIIWIPLQPYDKLNALLSTADIHLLPQKDAAADLVMPSKLGGMFASGRCVLAMCNLGTELYAAVHERGRVVPPGDIEAFEQAVIDLADAPETRRQLGARGREYAVAELGMDSVLQRFEQQALSALKLRHGLVAGH